MPAMFQFCTFIALLVSFAHCATLSGIKEEQRHREAAARAVAASLTGEARIDAAGNVSPQKRIMRTEREAAPSLEAEHAVLSSRAAAEATDRMADAQRARGHALELAAQAPADATAAAVQMTVALRQDLQIGMDITRQMDKNIRALDAVEAKKLDLAGNQARQLDAAGSQGRQLDAIADEALDALLQLSGGAAQPGVVNQLARLNNQEAQAQDRAASNLNTLAKVSDLYSQDSREERRLERQIIASSGSLSQLATSAGGEFEEDDLLDASDASHAGAAGRARSSVSARRPSASEAAMQKIEQERLELARAGSLVNRLEGQMARLDDIEARKLALGTRSSLIEGQQAPSSAAIEQLRQLDQEESRAQRSAARTVNSLQDAVVQYKQDAREEKALERQALGRSLVGLGENHAPAALPASLVELSPTASGNPASLAARDQQPNSIAVAAVQAAMAEQEDLRKALDLSKQLENKVAQLENIEGRKVALAHSAQEAMQEDGADGTPPPSATAQLAVLNKQEAKAQSSASHALKSLQKAASQYNKDAKNEHSLEKQLLSSSLLSKSNGAHAAAETEEEE